MDVPTTDRALGELTNEIRNLGRRVEALETRIYEISEAKWMAKGAAWVGKTLFTLLGGIIGVIVAKAGLILTALGK